ncbi:hypothetical protein GGR57DRAFT_383595 [Xylariaceae sp. FL1272]|nr:hypothetical protein GGR57DRAFT_383595 [Xylariaceae sp. FL1272]
MVLRIAPSVVSQSLPSRIISNPFPSCHAHFSCLRCTRYFCGTPTRGAEPPQQASDEEARWKEEYARLPVISISSRQQSNESHEVSPGPRQTRTGPGKQSARHSADPGMLSTKSNPPERRRRTGRKKNDLFKLSPRKPPKEVFKKVIQWRKHWPDADTTSSFRKVSQVGEQPTVGPTPLTKLPRFKPIEIYPKKYLSSVNARRQSLDRLVKTYTGKIQHGKPMLISNLPGFLISNPLIAPNVGQEGSFRKLPQKNSQDQLGYKVMRTIWASSVPANGGSTADRDDGRAMFDKFDAVLKIKAVAFEGDYPPILRFLDWVRQSRHLDDYQLAPVISELIEIYRESPQPWLRFRAPLVFIRAVNQYNLTQQPTPGELTPSKEITHYDSKDYPNCITEISALVVLVEKMTDDFPFPRIIRDIGDTRYNARSCSIRVGVRPLRTDMRRYKDSTVVVGQVAGYGVATLIPPSLQALNGASLGFHERVPTVYQDSLASQTWTREFEDELAKTGDVIFAKLKPGDGLLIPPGWWYGVRSINNGLHLNATSTWFLGRENVDQDEYMRGIHHRSIPPGIDI